MGLCVVYGYYMIFISLISSRTSGIQPNVFRNPLAANVSSCTVAAVGRRRGMTHSRVVQMTSFLLFTPRRQPRSTTVWTNRSSPPLKVPIYGLLLLQVEATRSSAVLVVIIINVACHVAELPVVTKAVAYTTPVV